MDKTSKVSLVITTGRMSLIIIILQESPESGGRGEAGKAVTNNKSGAKRRRSGIDMVGGGKVPVLANGQVIAGL